MIHYILSNFHLSLSLNLKIWSLGLDIKNMTKSLAISLNLVTPTFVIPYATVLHLLLYIYWNKRDKSGKSPGHHFTFHTVRCFHPTVQVVHTNLCRLCLLAVVFGNYAQCRNSLTTWWHFYFLFKHAVPTSAFCSFFWRPLKRAVMTEL